MYPELETYATPCDGYTHCLNGEDESLCSDDSTLNTILIPSVALIALLYLALKFWRITLYKICIKQNQEELQLKKSRKGRNRKKVLEKYQNNNENTEMIEKLNRLLLHSIFTKTSDETKLVCKQLYAILEKIHNKETSKIFSCLH